MTIAAKMRKKEKKRKRHSGRDSNCMVFFLFRIIMNISRTKRKE
jgi:hypothetical protein